MVRARARARARPDLPSESVATAADIEVITVQHVNVDSDYTLALSFFLVPPGCTAVDLCSHLKTYSTVISPSTANCG